MNSGCKPFLFMEIVVGFAPILFMLLIDTIFVLWSIFAVGALGEHLNIYSAAYFFFYLAEWMGLWGILYIAALVWHGVTSFFIPTSIRLFLLFWFITLMVKIYPPVELLLTEGTYKSSITWLFILPTAVSLHILWLGREYLSLRPAAIETEGT